MATRSKRVAADAAGYTPPAPSADTSPDAAQASLFDADGETLVVDVPLGAERLTVQYVDRARIHPDPEQPRVSADADLRASIAQSGLLQPITVRPHPAAVFTGRTGDCACCGRDVATLANGGDYMIVDGERRWQGSAGVLDVLPVLVRQDQDDPAERLLTQLTANTGKALDPLEEARSFQRLLVGTGASVADLAKRLGRPRSVVGERLGLLELGPWLPLLESGEIGLSHAVKHLVPLAGCTEKVHAHAVELARKEWRWEHENAGGGISVSRFGDLIRQFYTPSLYPLAKAGPTWAPQPLFNTKSHDEECACGGILFTLQGSDTKRRCCGNPDWWKPRDRKAKKAQQAKDAKRTSTHSTGPQYDLPEGAGLVQVRGWESPAGVTGLTNHAGQWAVRAHYQDRPFDPKDVTFDPKRLVLVQRPSGQSEVGTRDTKAIDAARDAWASRWKERRHALERERGAQLRSAWEPYQLSPDVPGRECARALLVRLAVAGDAASVAEVARCLDIDLGKQVAKTLASGSLHALAGQLAEWVDALALSEVAVLASAVATASAAGLQPIRDIVAGEERKAVDAIQDRKVPWLAADKKSAKKGGAKPKPAAAAPPPPAFDDEDDVDEVDDDEAVERMGASLFDDADDEALVHASDDLEDDS